MSKYDVAVIGGGPGGYTAAIRASQLGLKVCLYEPGRLGGTCLNTGCIPTKALYRSAEVYIDAVNGDNYGVETEKVSLDTERIFARKNEIVENLVSGVEKLVIANDIDLINESVTLETAKNRAENVIIATGSKPAQLPVSGADMPGVLNSTKLLSLEKIPESLAIVGGGVIGIEFANIFAALGAEVTVLEFLPEILPAVDKEIKKRLVPIMKKNNIKIHTSAKVNSITENKDASKERLCAHAEGKKGDLEVHAEYVLVATGRVPDIDSLELQNGVFNDEKILYDKHGIKVNQNCETNVPGIFAIGDVTGEIMLAHVASEEGVSVAEHIYDSQTGRDSSLKSKEADSTEKVVPSCIFSFPEIAYAGINEEEAKEKSIEYKVGKFMFGANGKALALGENRGLIKIISDNNNRILGVHILGPHASDLICQGVLAIEKRMTAEELSRIIYAHPTLGEVFHEAVLDLDNRAIHKV